jgi:vacuolar-type H+-ATPase subunit C/Vma6
MRGWEDVITRVRGLSSRLLGRPALVRLARSPDLRALVSGWAGTPYAAVPDDAVDDAARLERTTRRVAAQHLEVITDWCGPRVTLLAPLFEDEDRRNLRAVTRAVAAGTPVEQRTAGLLATPALPLALLDELARQARLRDVAALLSLSGNAYGRVMMPEASRAHPDLFLLQLAVDQEYFRRAKDMGDRAGDEMRWYIRLQIDAENVMSAFATAARAVERQSHDLFVEGGSISRSDYERLCTSEPAEARVHIQRIVAATPLAPLAALERKHDIESDLLAATITALKRTIRVAPLSLGVVLDYVLRLRAEVHDLARIVWGVSLDVPRRRIDAGLVTP